MARKSKTKKEKELTAEENFRLWKETMKGYKPDPLTLEEEMEIDRMRFAHEQSQKTKFVLNGEVVRVGACANPLFICKKRERG